MRAHELKTWPTYFHAVADGVKTFELRKNDRDFQIGDQVHLLEYEPATKTYTGRRIDATICYVLHGGCFGLEDGMCILQLFAITLVN